MANCSSANGTIAVNSLEGCSINAFWEALSTLTTKWDYGFTPNWSSDHEEATVSFFGIGR